MASLRPCTDNGLLFFDFRRQGKRYRAQTGLWLRLGTCQPMKVERKERQTFVVVEGFRDKRDGPVSALRSYAYRTANGRIMLSPRISRRESSNSGPSRPSLSPPLRRRHGAVEGPGQEIAEFIGRRGPTLPAQCRIAEVGAGPVPALHDKVEDVQCRHADVRACDRDRVVHDVQGIPVGHRGLRGLGHIEWVS